MTGLYSSPQIFASKSLSVLVTEDNFVHVSYVVSLDSSRLIFVYKNPDCGCFTAVQCTFTMKQPVFQDTFLEPLNVLCACCDVRGLWSEGETCGTSKLYLRNNVEYGGSLSVWRVSSCFQSILSTFCG